MVDERLCAKCDYCDSFTNAMDYCNYIGVKNRSKTTQGLLGDGKKCPAFKKKTGRNKGYKPYTLVGMTYGDCEDWRKNE